MNELINFIPGKNEIMADIVNNKLFDYRMFPWGYNRIFRLKSICKYILIALFYAAIDTLKCIALMSHYNLFSKTQKQKNNHDISKINNVQ